MKIQCAWCEKNKIQKIDEQNVITHTICSTCLRELLKGENKDLHLFINTLDYPVLIVNGIGNVLAKNSRADSLEHDQKSNLYAMELGYVLECKNAGLPGGCGNTTNCNGCKLRNAVTKTYELGKSVNQLPIQFQHSENGETVENKYLISTEKIKDVVLLRIDQNKN